MVTSLLHMLGVQALLWVLQWHLLRPLLNHRRRRDRSITSQLLLQCADLCSERVDQRSLFRQLP